MDIGMELLGLLIFIVAIIAIVGFIRKRKQDSPVIKSEEPGNTTPSASVSPVPPVPAPAPIPVPAPAPQPVPTGSDLDAFAKECLDAHNALRAKHGVDPLTWDPALADYAKTYASKCVWAHSMGPHGENLAIGYKTPTMAIQDWYDEIKQYDYTKPGYQSGTGHFTQVIWKNSKKVGCALVSCPNLSNLGSNGQYLVAEYDPPGNMNSPSQFTANVLPPKS